MVCDDCPGGTDWQDRAEAAPDLTALQQAVIDAAIANVDLWQDDEQSEWLIQDQIKAVRALRGVEALRTADDPHTDRCLLCPHCGGPVDSVGLTLSSSTDAEAAPDPETP